MFRCLWVIMNSSHKHLWSLQLELTGTLNNTVQPLAFDVFTRVTFNSMVGLGSVTSTCTYLVSRGHCI